MTRRAFSMVESAFAVAVVGVLLVASLSTFAALARNRAVEAERRLAYPLAQQLMAEVLQAYFAEPAGTPTFGPEAGETRATYDDVDDYNGLSETPPATRAGVALAGYAGWTRAVAVAYVSPAALAVSSTATTLKRVTVTVTAPSGKTYSLVGFRASMGAYEPVPTAGVTYVTGASVNVQASGAATSVWAGAHPLNETTSQ